MKHTKPHSLCKFTGLVALLAMLAACQGPATPEQVASEFWQAWQHGDVDKARSYCSSATAAALAPVPEALQTAQVRFDRQVIEGNDASLDTIVTFPAPPGAASAPEERRVTTYLVRESDRWMVEAARTQQALAPDASVESLARRIEQLGQELAKGVEEAGKEIDKKAPELQRQLEELGAQTQKQIGDAIEELRRKLDEAFKPEPEEPKGKQI